MNDEARARRARAINETRIGLMGQRIKREVNKMIEGGVSIEQVNETLPHIVFFGTHGVRKCCSVAWPSLMTITNVRARQTMAHGCDRIELPSSVEWAGEGALVVSGTSER